MAITATMNEKFNGNFAVAISKSNGNGGYTIMTPIVEDGVKWETDRQGSPGKLTFKLYKDKNSGLAFQEGDIVDLQYKDSSGNQVVVFKGTIFSKKRNKDGWIEVTAYDALRYFKNKQTYVYRGKTASDVIRMICKDHGLALGTFEETTYLIGQRTEDDQSLFDIAQNALDETLTNRKRMYILYSEGNKICLRDAENMKLKDIVINDATATDFDYESSIDKETYNDIELYYDNDKTNKREYYTAKHAPNMNKWGVLRLTESIQTPVNAQEKAKQMLQLYDRKTRTIKVSEAFGDYRCRAGASVRVILDLGDIKVDNDMMIEKATHTFKKDEYRMDLTLTGFKEEEIPLSEISTQVIGITETVEESETTTNKGLLRNEELDNKRGDITAIHKYEGETKDPNQYWLTVKVLPYGGDSFYIRVYNTSRQITTQGSSKVLYEPVIIASAPANKSLSCKIPPEYNGCTLTIDVSALASYPVTLKKSDGITEETPKAEKSRTRTYTYRCNSSQELVVRMMGDTV